MHSPENRKTKIANNDRILKEVLDFGTSDWLGKISILSFLCRSISNENAILILSFVMGLAEEPVEIPLFATRSLTFHFSKLQGVLAKLLPAECHPFLGDLGQLRVKEPLEPEFDEHEYMVASILEILITYSTREIDSFIKAFYEPRERPGLRFDTRDFFLDEARENWNRLGISKKYVIQSLGREDLECFLGFIEKNKAFSQEIILSVYFFNRSFYDVLELAVCQKELQQFYYIMPRIDLRKVSLGGLSFDTYRTLLINRPGTRGMLLRLLVSGEIVYDRNKVVSLVADKYWIFVKVIKALNLSLEESLEIAKKNEEMALSIVEDIERFETSEIGKIASFLLKKSDVFVKSLLAPVMEKESTGCIELVNSYLRMKPLSEDLKNFFVGHLSDNPNYFYSLMPYLKREKNLEYFSKLLVDEESLGHFLRVFTLNEIFYLAHYIHDIEHAKKVTKLCMENQKFDESVILFAIPKMELDALPPLFMRTVIISCMRFPSMRKFFVGLMHKLVKRSIWHDPDLFEGFVRALEVIGQESVGIMSQMPSEQISIILEKSRKLQEVTQSYFAEGADSEDKDKKRLKSILLSLK